MRLHGGLGLHGGHALRDTSSKASGPMMWTPRISPYLSSATTLTKPSWLAEDAGFAVRRERELADLHLEALRAGLRFGEPDAADARLGIGGAGDAVPVDGRGRLAGDVRHRDHAFHGCHVGQLRRASDDIADGVDTGLAGLLELVHFDEAAVELDLRVLEADVFRVRLAADGDQQLLGFDGLALAVRQRRT